MLGASLSHFTSISGKKSFGSVGVSRPSAGWKAAVRPALWEKRINSQAWSIAVPTVNYRSFATSAPAQSIKVERSEESFRIVVPLTNGEKCLMTFNQDQTVRQFLEDLKAEDSGIRKLNLQTEAGERVAQSTRLSQVFPGNLKLLLNDSVYSVLSPSASKQVTDKSEYNKLMAQFIPLYTKKRDLDRKATRYSTMVIWGGLGFLCAQFAFMARLVWWEFNWDIMEPVSYFVTFGTAVIGYAYFALARREYTFTDLRETVAVSRMRKLYDKNQFHVDQYYWLEHQLKEIDPLAVDRVEYETEAKELGIGDKNEAAAK